MRRLTLLDDASSVRARVVERNGEVFVLAIGDAKLQAELSAFVSNGLLLPDGRMIEAVDPMFLDHLGFVFGERGWTADLKASFTQHGTFGPPIAPPPPEVTDEGGTATEAALQTLYPVDTFTPLDTVTERHIDIRQLLESVDETTIIDENEERLDVDA